MSLSRRMRRVVPPRSLFQFIQFPYMSVCLDHSESPSYLVLFSVIWGGCGWGRLTSSLLALPLRNIIPPKNINTHTPLTPPIHPVLRPLPVPQPIILFLCPRQMSRQHPPEHVP